jgi:hypothetical protein
MKPDERAFEEHSPALSSETAGTGPSSSATLRRTSTRGLDVAELFAFIEATQAGEWGRLAKLHGGEARARERFADRLAKELDARGTVDVLRHGVVDLGIKIRLAFFKPAHGLTPELVARYEANRLTVTRQLPYEPGTNKTLDLALFVNGVPVATAELKNALTGQGVEDAKEPVPQGAGPEHHPRPPGGRPLRGGHRAGRHDDAAGGRLDALIAIQSGPQPRQGQPAQPARPPHRLPVGEGLGEGRLARPAGAVRPRREGG